MMMVVVVVVVVIMMMIMNFIKVSNYLVICGFELQLEEPIKNCKVSTKNR